MLSGSILGKIDRIWGQSACFKLCSAVLSFFSNAWSSSFLRIVLYRLAGLGRTDNGARKSGAYVRAAGASVAAAKNAFSGAVNVYDSSAFARIASGSALFRPGRISGIVFLVMFCVPHAAWRNWYALAAAAVLFVSVLTLSAAGKRPHLTAADLGRPIVVFGICCVISLLCSEAVYDSVRVLAFFASAFMFMWSASAGIKGRKALKEYLAWIYAAVMIVSLLGIAQKLAGVSVNASQTDLALNPGIGRVYSSLENPNNLAEFLVMFSPLCAVFAASGRTAMRRLVLAVGLVLPVTALLLTYSRSGWLSAALTAVIFVYFTRRRILPLIIVLAILAVPLLPSGVLLRLSNMFNPADTSADYRIRIWEATLRLLADQRRFITGIGPGPATLAAQIKYFADEYVLSGIVHSQMLYLELIVEFGLLGAVSALLAFAVPSVRASFVLKRCDAASLPARVLAACVSSMAGMALFGLFEYTWFYPRILFGSFLLLGIMKAAMRMAEAEANSMQSGSVAEDCRPQTLKRGILVSEAQQ
ncbi:MAG: O-antigen ligase family protein [Firmicutes bacterium]|nr:O-antigen ligase family protein [Bacillota bacterium]